MNSREREIRNDQLARWFKENPGELANEMNAIVLLLDMQIPSSYCSESPHIAALACMVRDIASVLFLEMNRRAEEKK